VLPGLADEAYRGERLLRVCSAWEKVLFVFFVYLARPSGLRRRSGRGKRLLDFGRAIQNASARLGVLGNLAVMAVLCVFGSCFRASQIKVFPTLCHPSREYCAFKRKLGLGTPSRETAFSALGSPYSLRPKVSGLLGCGFAIKGFSSWRPWRLGG